LRNKSNEASTVAFRKALALDPNFLDAQYHICINFIEQAAFKKCILEGEKIIAKDDGYANAYLVIGHAYKRMGQFGLADKYQKRAERINPKLKQ
jgi:Tfp pilus assembly protein PilF